MKELLSLKEASEVLKISTSTVRRMCDEEKLTCYRIGKSGYRKVKSSEVFELAHQYYGDSPLENQLPEHETAINNIPAETHPALYLMHKYWGRKAHNIVDAYIEYYSKEGEIVLDPFMGSGVTVIEALKLNRKTVGVDINPMSKFIVENTLSNVDLELFKKNFAHIYAKAKEQYGTLYYTQCPICKKNVELECAVWENDKLYSIRGTCSEHGFFTKHVEEQDIKVYEKCSRLLHDKNSSISYPQDEIFQYVKRSGRTHINELFSDRALIILSYIRSEIYKVEDFNQQQLLLFCFTSMLSNVSKMLPGDKEKATYKSGWVISKFWTPKIHTERNIFTCFELRFKAILAGKKDLGDINKNNYDIFTADACNLSFINDDSIDYVFTDPPYGESIAYLALSHFWNSWIKSDVDYENEIVIDSFRGKGYSDYSERIGRSYSEIYRVLKDKHYLSFTFNNRDLNVWKAVMDACINAGFILESIVYQEQAVSSGTQGINKKNTLRGDFVYNFRKDSLSKQNLPKNLIIDGESFVLREIGNYIQIHNGATPTQIYEFIIPLIVRNNAYTDKDGKVLNIEKILNSNFEYVENDDNETLGDAFIWKIKS